MKTKPKATHDLSPNDIWEEIICIQGSGESDWEKLDENAISLLRQWGVALCQWQRQICAGEVMKKGYGSTDRNEIIIINAPLPKVINSH